MTNATHIGTKQIIAKPMTRDEYNTYRNWPTPADENGDDAGFLVEYLDGGQANHPDHAGYISWSPAAVFDAAYQAMDAMTFGHAVEILKQGRKVARTGWNGKGMFVYLVAGSSFAVNRHPLLGIYEEGTMIDYRPHIDIKGADGSVSTWAPSIGDVLADDWQIVA